MGCTTMLIYLTPLDYTRKNGYDGKICYVYFSIIKKNSLLHKSRVRKQGTWEKTQSENVFLQKNVKSKKSSPLLGNFLLDKWKLFMVNLKPQRLIPSSCICDSVCASWSHSTGLTTQMIAWTSVMVSLSVSWTKPKVLKSVSVRGCRSHPLKCHPLAQVDSGSFALWGMDEVHVVLLSIHTKRQICKCLSQPLYKKLN